MRARRGIIFHRGCDRSGEFGIATDRPIARLSPPELLLHVRANERRGESLDARARTARETWRNKLRVRTGPEEPRTRRNERRRRLTRLVTP